MRGTDDDAVAAARRLRGKVLPVALVAAGVAGFFVFQSADPDPAPAEAAAAAAGGTTSVTAPAGPVVPVEPITLNLADGHYLELGFALQFAATESGEDEEDPSAGAPAQALDAAITTFSGTTFAQLADPAAAEQARRDFAQQVVETYGGAVTDVYFTSFVTE